MMKYQKTVCTMSPTEILLSNCLDMKPVRLHRRQVPCSATCRKVNRGVKITEITVRGHNYAGRLYQTDVIFFMKRN